MKYNKVSYGPKSNDKKQRHATLVGPKTQARNKVVNAQDGLFISFFRYVLEGLLFYPYFLCMGITSPPLSYLVLMFSTNYKEESGGAKAESELVEEPFMSP